MTVLESKSATVAQVHPLVLLSVVDHYNRVASNTSKRVVGVLLGQRQGHGFNVANAFALPFEEDEQDEEIWFLDHQYLESMFGMFKKINAYEKIIGWYHTGPKLRAGDLAINEVLRKYIPQPLLLIVNVEPSLQATLPTDAYVAVEEIHDDGTATTKSFEHIASEIVAEEAEEIGVEHLLRDVKDNSKGGLGNRITQTLDSLHELSGHLASIQSYLVKVLAKELPVNHQISYNLQKILNLIPDLSSEQVIKSFNVVNNDRLAVVYLSSLTRSIVALHELIDNKLANSDEHKAQEEKERELEEAKKTVEDIAAKQNADADKMETD